MRRGSREDVRRFHERLAYLSYVSYRDGDETPEFLAANRAVVEAEDRLPWWQQWLERSRHR